METRLLERGLAALRLNLRGARAGRTLLSGTYAARCSEDLRAVLRQARVMATRMGAAQGQQPLLLFGVGEPGGKILLHTCLDARLHLAPQLDGLVCISSPLDPEACSRSIDQPRNRPYQAWLLRRLGTLTLADPQN